MLCISEEEILLFVWCRALNQFVTATLAATCLEWRYSTVGTQWPRTPDSNRGTQDRPAPQAPDLLTGQMTHWSWRTMTSRFSRVWRTGRAPLPHCWHTGVTQQHCTGHRQTLWHLLTSKGTAKDTFYSPKQQTPCQSSICKPDLWSHPPTSSYPPKICVASSGKGPDTTK